MLRQSGSLDIDVGSALHMVIGAFLEGESKMLADTAEVNNPQNLDMHKSGRELWRLLKYNFDRASAFNVISIVESIRNMQAAKNIQRCNVERRDIWEYATDKLLGQRSQSSSRCRRVASVSTQRWTRNRTWCKCFLDVNQSTVLKKGTNIDFEKDSYFQCFETWLQQSCTTT